MTQADDFLKLKHLLARQSRAFLEKLIEILRDGGVMSAFGAIADNAPQSRAARTMRSNSRNKRTL